MIRPNICLLGSRLRSAATIGGCLALISCSEDLIDFGGSSKTSLQNQAAVTEEMNNAGLESDERPIDEPISVSGIFLTFQCYQNPEINFNNQLVHCGFADKSGAFTKLDTVNEITLSGITAEDYIKQDSKIANFQWDLWFPEEVDLGVIRVTPILESLPENTQIEIDSLVKEMSPEWAETITEIQEDYENEDEDYFNLSPSPINYVNAEQFFQPGEPNNSQANENCITFYIKRNGLSEVVGWNDETCLNTVFNYPFACQHNFNPLLWTLSTTRGDPGNIATIGDPCPVGYHWDHPDNDAENEEFERIAYQQSPMMGNFQVWLNLQFTSINPYVFDQIYETEQSDD
ncbi:MAG: hypothetical protein CMP10_18125 [Zetaproteobacteria bacterium]|nr:hypothetical protein [Pseudobdellovibrionaceae bacterium]